MLYISTGQLVINNPPVRLHYRLLSPLEFTVFLILIIFCWVNSQELSLLNIIPLCCYTSTLSLTEVVTTDISPKWNTTTQSDAKHRQLRCHLGNTHTDTLTYWHTDTLTHWHTDILTHCHADILSRWHTDRYIVSQSSSKIDTVKV